MADQSDDDISKNYERLDYTQTRRQQIADSIIDEAVKNKDGEMLRTALQTLDGMDRASLGRLKVNEKAKENKTSAQEAEILSGVITRLAERRASPLNDKTKGTSAVRGTKLPDKQRPAYDPSMRDAAPTGENTNDFRSRMEGGGKKKN